MKKTIAESHRILVDVYGEHALADLTCQKQFARFKSGDFGLKDEERPGQPKKFENEELEALLDADCCRTQEDAKPSQFLWDGIHKLPERWGKVIASDGQYFE